LPRSPSAEQIAGVLVPLEALRDNLAKQLEDFANHQNMSGNALQNERHIQNSEPESQIEVEPSSMVELKAQRATETTARQELIKHFPLAIVLKACPEISNYAPGGTISNWREMITAAIVVHSTLRVSSSAFQEACRIMGPENAAAAIACILERAELISSAGGYLRDLTRRAQRGEFSLGPMLMALLRAPSTEIRRAS
jgi:replication initiation protein RepC